MKNWLTILQDEKPLEGASIALIPSDAASRWSAGGMTDAKGEARIIVHGKYEGGAPGRYRLCVSKVEADPDDPAQDRSPGTETVSPDTYDLIDPKFGDVETVQEIEIVAGQTNEWTVDVGKAVRIRIPKRK